MADDKDYLEKSEKDKLTADNSSNDEEDYEKICFMCRRPESKAGKMIISDFLYLFSKLNRYIFLSFVGILSQIHMSNK